MDHISPKILEFLFHNPIFGIVIIDRNRIIHQVNDRFVELSGYSSKEELLETDSRNLYFSDDDYNRLGHLYYESIKNNEVFRVEFPFKAKQGHAVWLSISGQIIEPGFIPNFEGGAIWIIEDISKEVQTMKALEKSYRELETIFSNSMVGILMVKDNRIVHRVNQRFLDITGYKNLHDIVGLSVEDFHVSHEHFVHFGENYYNNLINHEMIAVDYQFKKKDGAIIWVTIAGKAIDPNSPPNLDEGVVWTLTDITEKKKDEERLTKMAETDELTSLYNRRYFMKVFSEEVHRYQQLKIDFSVLLIDLDYFKLVNDVYGHDIGDQVLKEFATICRNNLRSTDIIGRLGGEEFGIILPGSSLQIAYEISEKLRNNIASHPWRIKNKITISCGIASTSEIKEREQLNQLIKMADEKLYIAKEKGRNIVII